jgi:hypothetical protein
VKKELEQAVEYANKTNPSTIKFKKEKQKF